MGFVYGLSVFAARCRFAAFKLFIIISASHKLKNSAENRETGE